MNLILYFTDEGFPWPDRVVLGAGKWRRVAAVEITAAGADTNYLVQLDRVRVCEFPVRELALIGSCGDSSFQALEEMELQCGSHTAPCRMHLRRDDIAAHFAQPCMALAGFAARIPLDPEAIFFRLVARAGAERPIVLLARVPEPDGSLPQGAEADPNDYRAWLAREERSLFWAAEEAPARIARLAVKPTFSVMLRVHDPDPYALYRSVRSLLNQNYADWRLVIACAGSARDCADQTLRAADIADSRVSLTTLPAPPQAVAHREEFLLSLTPGDEFHAFALTELARQIDLTPEAAILYSDEDRIDDAGERSHPVFKGPFDPELLLGYNHLGRLCCLRAALVAALGNGEALGSWEAAEWDFLLRASETVPPARIVHIAKPLYHARSQPRPDPVALHDALQACLRRREIDGIVEPALVPGALRVRWNVPVATRTAVVLRMEDGAFQYDLASRARMPGAVDFYELFMTTLRRIAPGDIDRQRIVLTQSEMDAEVVIFVNGPLDSVSHFFFEELIGQCHNKDCGMAGGVVVDVGGRNVGGCLEALPDGTFLDSAADTSLSSPGYLGRFRLVRSVAALGPQFFAVRSTVLEEAGGLARLNADRMDVLCGALSAICHSRGLRVVFTPYAVATMRAHQPSPVDGAASANRAGGSLAGPYLNPNLASLRTQ